MATDLEIMIHAKSYLDKLANGINPLTDQMLPESDIVNQVRISRCLFYVSDVLRQVIEKGGLKKTPKGPQSPFALTPEQIGRFQFFESPIHVTAIAERLNFLREDEHMRRLKHRSITDFLEREGFLTSYTDTAGAHKRKPTDQGLALGISVEMRDGYKGPYTVILYDQNAQQYILDHLDEIAEINRTKGKSQKDSAPDQAERIDPETGEIIRG